jgi:hypothetical protein
MTPPFGSRIASTALFAVGVAIERSRSENTESPSGELSHTDEGTGGEATEGGSDKEGSNAAETGASTEHSESDAVFLGVDLESWWLVAVAVAVSLRRRNGGLRPPLAGGEVHRSLATHRPHRQHRSREPPPLEPRERPRACGGPSVEGCSAPWSRSTRRPTALPAGAPSVRTPGRTPPVSRPRPSLAVRRGDTPRGIRSGTPARRHAGSPTRQETTINDPPSRESLEGASPVDVGHRDRADP